MPPLCGGRRGLTLVELIVSVAILTVLMAMIGMVFNLASRTSSQSTAITGVHRQLRLVRETLRRDLDGITPERSCLAIAAVLVNTYETPADRANGKLSNHRADMLMFFTNHAPEPYVTPGTDGGRPVQVVYGHANLDELNPDNPDVAWLGPRRLVESTAIDASGWHLARRVVFFENVSGPTADDPGFASPAVVEAATDVATLGGAPPFVAEPFNFDFYVTNTPLVFRPPIYRTTIIRNWFYNPPGVPGRTVLDPTPPAGKSAQMAYYLLPGCADFKVEYTYDDPTEATAIEPTRWIDPLVAAPVIPGVLGRMEWLAGSPDFDYLGTPPGSGGTNQSPDWNWVNANSPPDPFDPSQPLVKVRTWPRAIRITMRVYDRRGFLTERTVPDPDDLDQSGRGYRYEPIEFVYVHAF